jgi:pilus assembly protein CpaB
MNWKTWVPLILAIVLGVAAAKVARDQIMKTRLAAGPAGKFVEVVVAKGDLNPGKEIKPDDLVMAKVQENAVPATSFKTMEELNGRSVEMAVSKGQPIVESMLTQTGSGSGLQGLIPLGMRAITIEVNEFSGLAGLITPGVKVDVVATLSDGGNGSQVARTIVQNIQVKAVGQRTTVNSNEPPNPSEMFRSVTLIAKPTEAEAIELAAATGRPRLVLRGGRDNEEVASAGITLSELRGTAKDEEDPFSSGKPFVINPTTKPSSETASTPTTGPSEKPEAFAHRGPPPRVVRVIRGGVESKVTLQALDGNPDNAVSDTKDPFDNNSSSTSDGLDN